MATSQIDNNAQQQSASSSYLIAATTTNNNANENQTLCDIKILCTQRKKKSKYYTYLTFIDSCNLLPSSNEQACIEIQGKTTNTNILLKDCISFEYFDEIKNDFQSFIYIFFQSYTIAIYFSEENFDKKPIIIKHLEYMSKQKLDKTTEITNQQPAQELPCLTTTTEQILHTFDIKLIPYDTIITNEHVLLGPARIYFTTTDLYIASRDCNRMDLRTTIINQCPSKEKNILCIPYFTIKHYGNRSNIFLIELGKSNYGNGEIHMKCHSSSLASTIHLLVSPVIEERPLILSSAFRNQLLTSKRIEKSKNLQPPIQLTNDTITDPLPFMKKFSIDSLTNQSTNKLNKTKSRSVFGFFRKLVKNSNSPEQSSTCDNLQEQQANLLPPLANKFFELNIDEKKPIVSSQSQIITNNNQLPVATTTTTIANNGQYIDMGPTLPKSDQNQQEQSKQEEETSEESTSTVDVGVNTIISLSPHVRSAIIVGNTVHLIAEDRSVFPIGQRSFTSPASVMQPFKAQLHGQTMNTNSTSTDMVACAPTSSNSFNQSTSPSNSRQSLLLSYAIVTFNKNPLLNDQADYAASLLSEGSTIDRRLNSDISLMSLSHQQQPSNIYSFDNFLSSSSSSHIFRTLSLSTNNVGDNTSAHIRNSHGSIIFVDESHSSEQQGTTTYLLGPPPPPPPPPAASSTLVDETNTNLSSVNLPKSLSRSHLSNIDEEKLSSNDSYALVEPLNLQDTSSQSSLSTVLTKPSLTSNKSLNYTDLLLPSNTGDEQQECYSSDDNNNQCKDLTEEKSEQSSSIFYTDIDFHQTQRRDRIAQFAAISKLEDQTPPFVL